MEFYKSIFLLYTLLRASGYTAKFVFPLDNLRSHRYFSPMSISKNYRKRNPLSPNSVILANTFEFRNKLRHGQYYWIFELQKRYGLRYVETRSISKSNIVNNQYIWVPGAKKSLDRPIYAPDFIQWILQKNDLPANTPVFDCSYWDYYRWLKKHVNLKPIGHRKNQRVTNQARSDFFTQFARHTGGIDESVATAGGHKTTKSTRYYVDIVSLTAPQK